MLFVSQSFIFLFAPVAITGYWLLPKRLRIYWLIIAGYAFFALWDWRFTFLLLLTTLVDFFAGKFIYLQRNSVKAVEGGNSELQIGQKSKMKAWLALSLVTNLGLLAFFKYAGFLATSADAISRFLGGGALPIPEILLPAGISFYTFRSIAYTIDIYLGRQTQAKGFFEYAAFVSFFPEIIAGPIDRFKDLASQFRNLPDKPPMNFLFLGLLLFAIGLLKKVLIADRIAYYVNPLWHSWATLSAGEAWAAALGYTSQIYFDFSGYSLMAAGLGFLMGIKVAQNFNSPYRASDIGDFWRRWHMTLSFWFRDYVFFAFGGMRLNLRWVSLFWTMALCGLWHGAAWAFMIWGALHGAMLICHHFLRENKIRWKGGWPGKFGTLFLVIIGWVLFRAGDFEIAIGVFAKMIGLNGPTAGAAVQPVLLLLTAASLAWAVFAPNAYSYFVIENRKPHKRTLAVIGFLAAVAVLLSADSAPFLYAQF